MSKVPSSAPQIVTLKPSSSLTGWQLLSINCSPALCTCCCSSALLQGRLFFPASLFCSAHLIFMDGTNDLFHSCNFTDAKAKQKGCISCVRTLLTCHLFLSYYEFPVGKFSSKAVRETYYLGTIKRKGCCNQKLYSRTAIPLLLY